jgi:hypothetical protein
MLFLKAYSLFLLQPKQPELLPLSSENKSERRMGGAKRNPSSNLPISMMMGYDLRSPPILQLKTGMICVL